MTLPNVLKLLICSMALISLSGSVLAQSGNARAPSGTARAPSGIAPAKSGTVSALSGTASAPSGTVSQPLAQTGIRGRVIDTVAHQSMAGADIQLLRLHSGDTLLLKSLVADDSGRFSLDDLSSGPYLLKVLFLGYNTWVREINVQSGSLSIYMTPEVDELQKVVVKDTQEVYTRGDTTVYRADKFHTRPNGTLNNLLDKLPGVRTDEQGNMISGGDTVQQFMVNGKLLTKEGLDALLANLPKDMVGSVEFFNDKSDQTKFTGVDDGIRRRTLNVVLKKDARTNLFGSAEVGMGTEDEGDEALYKATFNGNHMNIGKDMAFFNGSATNTQPVLGGTASSIGGNGFYNYWHKQNSINAQYGFTDYHSKTNVSSYTQSLVPGDSALTGNQANFSQRSSFSQYARMDMRFTLDEHNFIGLSASMNESHSTDTTNGISNSFLGDATPLNQSKSSSTNESVNWRYSVSANYSHNFQKKGRTLSFNVSTSPQSGHSQGINQSTVNYVNATGNTDSLVTTNQFNYTPNNAYDWSYGASYNEPLNAHNNISVNYTGTISGGWVGRTTYGWDSLSRHYDQLDTALTNLYQSRYQQQKAGLAYGYSSKLININAGLGWMMGTNTGTDVTVDNVITQHYVNLIPSLMIRANPEKGENFSLGFNRNVQQPPIMDLMPIISNWNPLYIALGNPNLKQAVSNSFSLRFQKNTNPDRPFSATLNLNLIQNAIASKTQVDTATGADTSMVVNVNGSYNIYGTVDYSLPLPHPRSHMDLSLHLSNNHGVNYLNNTLNISNDYVAAGYVKWTTNLPDHVDLTITYAPTYTILRYSASPSQNSQVLNQSIKGEGLYYVGMWEVGSDLQGTFYAGQAPGYNLPVTIWNMTFTRFFFKDKKGELKFYCHDLLNDAQGRSMQSSPTVVRYTQGSILGRYYMLSFVYHFKL